MRGVWLGRLAGPRGFLWGFKNLKFKRVRACEIQKSAGAGVRALECGLGIITLFNIARRSLLPTTQPAGG